jgi:hypothetical protein
MAANTTNDVGQRAGLREWTGLAVLGLACLLYSMDLTVLHLAVPKLSAALQPSSAQLLWIIDVYGFLIAGSLITMGTLGDRIGRRRLLRNEPGKETEPQAGIEGSRYGKAGRHGPRRVGGEEKWQAKSRRLNWSRSLAAAVQP